MDAPEAKNQAKETIAGEFTVVWNDLANSPAWAILSRSDNDSVVPYFVKEGDKLTVFRELETLRDGVKKEELFSRAVSKDDLSTTADAYRLCSEEFQKNTPPEWFGGNLKATVTLAQPARDSLDTTPQKRTSPVECLLPA